MKISINFKNIDPSDALRDYAANKLSKLDKHFDSPSEAQVVLSVEKIRHIAEVRISCDGLNIQAKEENENMYAALDLVLDKLKKQIRRNKEKTRQKRPLSKEGIKGSEFEIDSMEDEEASSTRTTSIITETLKFKPMDPEEAAMQLDLANQPFIVFTDAKTSNVNVLYKRSDGNLGLIKPDA